MRNDVFFLGYLYLISCCSNRVLAKNQSTNIFSRSDSNNNEKTKEKNERIKFQRTCLGSEDCRESNTEEESSSNINILNNICIVGFCGVESMFSSVMVGVSEMNQIDSCETDADCDSGYFCSAVNTCAPYRPECLSNDDCNVSSGYICENEFCVLQEESDDSNSGEGESDHQCGRFNYTVALFNENIEEEGVESRQFICGGSLISSRWILTSASCDVGTPNKAVIGRCDFNDESEEDYEEIQIINKIIHPEYRHHSTSIINTEIQNDYDFMILELEFESKHTPIKVDNGTIDIKPLLYGGEEDELTALGWGYQNDEVDNKEKLKTVPMHYIPNQRCQLNYLLFLRQPITQRMMCTKRADSDMGPMCNGDRGGPLIAHAGEEREEDILFGVTSFNLGCSMRFESVSGRVSSVLSWLSEYMDLEGVIIEDPYRLELSTILLLLFFVLFVVL